MFERGINRRMLSEQAGIPYTTIVHFYTNGYENVKLSTLLRLCEYFGVTLDYLVKEDIPPAVVISHEEQSLLTIYRCMNQEGRQTLMTTAKSLAANPDLQKNTDDQAI